MKRQNRTLIVVVGFALIILAVILYRQGIFDQTSTASEKDSASGITETAPESLQESMGEPLKDNSGLEQTKIEEQKMFQLILTDLSACFELKGTVAVDLVPVTIENILSYVQTDFGPATVQADHWMSWHLRTKSGEERRMRMELSEGDDGKVMKQLKYFVVDKEGLPIPVELSADKSDNPSDDVINQMLKEGDVFYKEKAAAATFSSGERIEFIEKNGNLAEFEFLKGERSFRCQNFKSRESCQCNR